MSQLDNDEIEESRLVCNGDPGTDGSQALIKTSEIEPGDSHCPHGGQFIETGRDTNANGLLDQEEVETTSYVCNGSPGKDGQQGPEGPPAPDNDASCSTTGGKRSFSIGMLVLIAWFALRRRAHFEDRC